MQATSRSGRRRRGLLSLYCCLASSSSSSSASASASSCVPAWWHHHQGAGRPAPLPPGLPPRSACGFLLPSGAPLSSSSWPSWRRRHPHHDGHAAGATAWAWISGGHARRGAPPAAPPPRLQLRRHASSLEGGSDDKGPAATTAWQRAPRLYCAEAPLRAGALVALSADQRHYLTKVMRLRHGAAVRVFNEEDGEWLCRLEAWVEGSRRSGKKAGRMVDGSVMVVAEEQLRPPLGPEALAAAGGLRLCFAPIKRARLKTMLEKATELGATQLQPVVTEYTDLKDDHTEEMLRKMEAGLVEAAEQCERLSLPRLLAPVPLAQLLSSSSPSAAAAPLYVCREREGGRPLLSALDADAATLLVPGATPSFLIGPEGGFSPAELQALDALASSGGAQPGAAAVRSVSLGPMVLRAETAAAVALGCYVAWREGKQAGGSGGDEGRQQQQHQWRVT